jgi:hypothetical protein
VKLTLVMSIVALLLLGGCASREELIAKSAVTPAGVNLSGQWQLRAASRDTVARIKDAELKAAGGAEGIRLVQTSQQRSRRRSTEGSLVHVFLEMGDALKITQTDFGLFISFDRAIVEEYRFGEKRRISVGEIQADRVSGWENNTYIIETLDMDEARLVETYSLDDHGQTLRRKIVVIDDDERQVDVTQVFDRS